MAQNPPKAFTEREQIIRGNEMERIMQEPIVIEVFEKVEAAAIAAWKVADTPSKREACHAKITALEGLKKEMVEIVERREYAKAIEARAARTGGR